MADEVIEEGNPELEEEFFDEDMDLYDEYADVDEDETDIDST